MKPDVWVSRWRSAIGRFGGRRCGAPAASKPSSTCGSATAGSISGSRRVERELALLDQPHRRDRRDQLHHRGDAEHRVAGHRGVFGRAAAQSAAAEHALIEDAVLGGGHRHNARHFLRGRRRRASLRRCGEGAGARRLLRERAGACARAARRSQRAPLWFSRIWRRFGRRMMPIVRSDRLMLSNRRNRLDA